MVLRFFCASFQLLIFHQLNIDGASVPDPASLYYYGASRWGSGIEVPSADQDFW